MRKGEIHPAAMTAVSARVFPIYIIEVSAKLKLARRAVLADWVMQGFFQ